MSGNSNLLASILSIRVDGAKLATENKGTFTPEGVKRDKLRHGKKTYHTEEETAPELKVKVLLTKDVDVKKLNEIDNATILVEINTGQQYYMRNSFAEDVVPLDAEGVAEVIFSCDSTDLV